MANIEVRKFDAHVFSVSATFSRQIHLCRSPAPWQARHHQFVYVNSVQRSAMVVLVEQRLRIGPTKLMSPF
jgi:hypothetical protein